MEHLQWEKPSITMMLLYIHRLALNNQFSALWCVKSYYHLSNYPISSNAISSVAQSCLTLRVHGLQHAGLPVHHQLLAFTQTHVHWVSDAIQPSHPLSSTSPPALDLSQHQCLFKWVSSLQQVANVLEFQLQHQSFQWIFKTDFR